MDEAEPSTQQSSARLPRPIGAITSHWGLAVAIIVPVVTAATIVIPLIADAGARSSSVETLAVDGVVQGEHKDSAQAIGLAQASSVGLGSTEIVNAGGSTDYYWRVPSTAPFETLPLLPASGSSCAPEQLAWLEKWGHRAESDTWNGYLTLSNVATSGSSMSVSNIHSVGTMTLPAVPEVAVECFSGRGDGSEIIHLFQTLGSSDPATFDGSYDGSPTGAPAVINISPGEFVQTSTYFSRLPADAYANFEGSYVADVDVGGKTTEVVLYQRFTRIGGPEITTASLKIMGDTISCGPDDDPFSNPCTIDTFISMVRADPGFTR